MNIELLEGDCRESLEFLADDSIDSIVTDPPYALVSIGKRYGKEGSAPAQYGTDGAYARASAGFMGKTWDTSETAFAIGFWQECLRVLKPGGHVVAFSGTRTYHRLAVAIEDAGFEVRDQLAWVYGTGFPKSHNAGDGWGTALKPAWEPIVFARKPLIGTVAANVLAHGTGAINIDGCRVETNEDRRRNARGGDNGLSGESTFKIRERRAEDQTETSGRWPANILHDGSDEVVSLFPDSKGQRGTVDGQTSGRNVYGEYGPRPRMEPRNDSGSAARFFYSAKASKADRAGSKHPTVKPVALMRWLCRLVTPPGGTVLDPFAGSGTTGQAAREEGFDAILCEREAEYIADIKSRLGLGPVSEMTTDEDIFA